METVLKLLSVVFVLLSLTGIAGAEDILGTHQVEDVTHYNSSGVYDLQSYNYVISTADVWQSNYLEFEDPLTINISSDTWTLNITTEELNFYTIRNTVNFTDSDDNFTSEIIDIHYVIYKPLILISISSNGYPYEGVRVSGLGSLVSAGYIEHELTPSTWIAVESNNIISLEYDVVTAAEAEAEAGEDSVDKMIDYLRYIPLVGDILADSMSSLKLIFEVFLAVVLFAITGWAILFLLFETLVLAHAIAVMKMSGGGIVGVVGVFSVIASDNYIMIMFVVNVFTRMFTLLVDLARTIWNLIPFI